MDHAHYDELLTAYVDRELSPDERASVDRLLEDSAAARQRLLDLKATSNFLRRLPRRQLDDDFADGVIERLRRESLLRPEPVAPQPRSPRWVGWVGGSLAAAATLVLGVWMGRGMQRGVQRDDSPVADSFNHTTAGTLLAINDQLRPGDAIRIASETSDQEVQLIILQQREGESGWRGILLEPGSLLPRAFPESGDASEGPIATFVANDADVQRMSEVASEWGAQNSAPIVDVSFQPAATTLEFVGNPETRQSRIADADSLSPRGNASTNFGKFGESVATPEAGKEPGIAKLLDNAPNERAAGRAMGTVTESDRGTPPAAATVAGKPESSVPARDAAPESAPTDPAGIDKAGNQTDASPEAGSVAASNKSKSNNRGQSQNYRGRATAIEPNARREKTAGAAAENEKASSDDDAANSLAELKKLAERDPDAAIARMRKLSEPPRERMKILLQYRDDTEPERRGNRN